PLNIENYLRFILWQISICCTSVVPNKKTSTVKVEVFPFVLEAEVTPDCFNLIIFNFF
ncbi:MAG: hypothetical protein ACI9YH_004637, partial [Colwellia sp.]